MKQNIEHRTGFLLVLLSKARRELALPQRALANHECLFHDRSSRVGHDFTRGGGAGDLRMHADYLRKSFFGDGDVVSVSERLLP